ncbi:MAG: ABC transporter ATP-binding protein [Coprobacillus sp.]
MEKILEVKRLEKSFDKNKAVNDLSFYVNKGEILGLLGPNGAGKSTTISILSTILKSDKGDISAFGYSFDKQSNQIKSQLGIVPQEIAIYEDISAYRNVAFFASLYNLTKQDLNKRVIEALSFVGLEDKKDDKPKTFSGGMKRRLNIACAIAHQPKLLILDEPTVGIDPQSRNHILSSLKILKDQGTTIIYTTHYMEEVEEIADRIIIMDKGEKIAEGTLKELLEKYKDTLIYTLYLDKVTIDIEESLLNIEGVQSIQQEENKIQITVSKNNEVLDKIILFFVQHNCHIQKMETEEGNLEMVFLELTGKKLRD